MTLLISRIAITVLLAFALYMVWRPMYRPGYSRREGEYVYFYNASIGTITLPGVTCPEGENAASISDTGKVTCGKLDIPPKEAPGVMCPPGKYPTSIDADGALTCEKQIPRPDPCKEAPVAFRAKRGKDGKRIYSADDVPYVPKEDRLSDVFVFTNQARGGGAPAVKKTNDGRYHQYGTWRWKMTPFDKNTEKLAMEVLKAQNPFMDGDDFKDGFAAGRNSARESLMILARAVERYYGVSARGPDGFIEYASEAIVAVKARGDWPLEEGD